MARWATITPAYGRVYASRRALLEDFDANKDFTLHDVMSRWDGKLCNKSDLIKTGYTHIVARYGKGLGKVTTFPIQRED